MLPISPPGYITTIMLEARCRSKVSHQPAPSPNSHVNTPGSVRRGRCKPHTIEGRLYVENFETTLLEMPFVPQRRSDLRALVIAPHARQLIREPPCAALTACVELASG